MAKRVALLSAASLLIALGPAWADSPSNISALLDKAGAFGLAEGQVAGLKSALDKAQQGFEGLGIPGAEVRARLEPLMSPAALRERVARRMSTQLDERDVAALATWFDTPLGRRSVAALYALGQASAPAMQQALPQLMRDARRVTLAQSIDEAMGGSQTLAAMLVQLQSGMLAVASATEPSLKDLALATREGMELTRPVMANSIRGLMVAGLLFTYRDWTDAELMQLAAFAQQAAARKFYRALNETSLATMNEAFEALGELAAQAKPAAPSVNVQQSGRVTNVAIAGPAIDVPRQVYAQIRQLPPSEDAAVIAWTKRHANELPPVFLLEAARRQWTTDHAGAFEWYALGSLRARYDALRCTDRSAAQGIYALSGAAPEVTQGIDAERDAYREAGLRALAREDLFAGRASPWWICSHGMAAMNAALSKRPLPQSQWLAAESEWPAMREKLRTDMARYYVEQAKPQDDPVPMSERKFPVVVLSAQGYEKYVWLDATRLARATSEAGPDKKPVRRLELWSRDGASRTLETASVMSWCAGNGNLYYTTAHQKKGLDGTVTLDFISGPPESTTANTAVATAHFIEADQANNGSLGGARMSGAWRQSPFDCRWVQSAELSGTDGLRRWLPLLPTHGFLAFHHDRHGASASGPLLFYASQTSAPKELPIASMSVPPAAIGYYPFKGAYFVAQVRGPHAPGKSELASCVWWLKPASGETEEICLPASGLDEQVVSFAPSQLGILRRVFQRQTAQGPKPGGIYLTTPNGRSEKIYEGEVRDWAVSPDGCAVAARHGGQLKVIELCS